jgi:hypothetical protein
MSLPRGHVNFDLHIYIYQNRVIFMFCDTCRLKKKCSRCAGCLKRRYCSKACQKEDWFLGRHSQKCAIMKNAMEIAERAFHNTLSVSFFCNFLRQKVLNENIHVIQLDIENDTELTYHILVLSKTLSMKNDHSEVDSETMVVLHSIKSVGVQWESYGDKVLAFDRTFSDEYQEIFDVVVEHSEIDMKKFFSGVDSINWKGDLLGHCPVGGILLDMCGIKWDGQ